MARVARYDAERGIGTLFIEEISRASADQRKGRAGRTAPGTCYRLWTESGQLNRPERNTPEIQRSDLAEVVLLLHSLGIKRAAEFDWLDKPDPQAVERAENLLRTLGALKPSSRSRDTVPLTPALSPSEGERENRFPASGKSTGAELSDKRQTIPPPIHPPLTPPEGTIHCAAPRGKGGFETRLAENDRGSSPEGEGRSEREEATKQARMISHPLAGEC